MNINSEIDEYQEPNFLEILSNTYEFDSSQTNEHILPTEFQIGKIQQTICSNFELDKYLCLIQNDIPSDEICSICINQLIIFSPDYSNSENKICSISCGHKFHQKCIVEWLKKKTNCPECRQYCKIYNKNKNEFESIAPHFNSNMFDHDYDYEIRQILRNNFGNRTANRLDESMNQMVNDLRNILRDGSENELRHDSENILRGVFSDILMDGLTRAREYAQINYTVLNERYYRVVNNQNQETHGVNIEDGLTREREFAQINYTVLNERYYRVVNNQNQETHDVNIEDARIVAEQSSCDITHAIIALISNGGDIVNAIMELTIT